MNCKLFVGIFYVFVASFSLTVQSVFVKQLSYISPAQLSLVRNVGIWAGSIPIAIYSLKEFFGPKDYKKILVVRGLLSATAMYLYLVAFRYLPLAEAAILISTVPAIITVMARVFLKEPCGLVQSFSVVISLCGVLLAIRLPDLLSQRNSTEIDSNYFGGLAAAFACVFTMSTSYVVLRKLKHIHFGVSIMYFGFFGMIEFTIINTCTSHFVVPHCGWDQVFVMLIAILGFIGTVAINLAVQTEAVGIVSVTRASMDVIIAIVFQVVIFGMYPDIYNVIGSCLVIVSVGIIGLNKWLISVPEDSQTRKRFKYLLM